MHDNRGVRSDDAVEAAISWHLRLSSATAQEWQTFVAWLEADPAHAAAYDRVTLDDDLLTRAERPALQTMQPLAAANDEDGDPRWRWRGSFLAGSAIAAALALALVLPRAGTPGDLEIRTAPGHAKLVAFADGSRIALNGGSRLRLEPGNARFAALESGEATFEIKHDAARPFEVRSGALTLRDLGTTFNVVRAAERLGVQVSEGAVMFEPERAALTIRPGFALKVDEAARTAVVASFAPGDVGGWRHGRLAFGAEPLADVAAAVGRVTGLHIGVAPALAHMPFTGSLRLYRDGAGTVEKLALLSGNRAKRVGDGWSIVPASNTRE